MVQILSVYNDSDKRVRGDLNCKDESLTQQQFAKEADINQIMKRYSKTGVLVDPTLVSERQPMYVDNTEGSSDFFAAQCLLAKVQESFAMLPAAVRDRFQNKPELMLDFVADEKNFDECVKMGLVAPKESVKDAQPIPASPVAPAPVEPVKPV